MHGSGIGDQETLPGGKSFAPQQTAHSIAAGLGHFDVEPEAALALEDHQTHVATVATATDILVCLG